MQIKIDHPKINQEEWLYIYINGPIDTVVEIAENMKKYCKNENITAEFYDGRDVQGYGLECNNCIKVGHWAKECGGTNSFRLEVPLKSLSPFER